MELGLTEEQRILRDSLKSFLAERYDMERRQRSLARGAGSDLDIWRALGSELGLLGVTFDEADGGLGGGGVDVLVIMEALGEHLVLEPFLETVVLCGRLLRSSRTPLARELVGRIVRGEARAALAYLEPGARDDWRNVGLTATRRGRGWRLDGRKCLVSGAAEAEVLLVSARTAGARRDMDGVAVFALDAGAAGLSRRDYRTIDGRPASDIELADVTLEDEARLTAEGEALPLLERALDEAVAAVCGEAAGVLRRMVRSTADYARERRQFGAPIATFQALQHRMVDMLLQSEQAAAVAEMAARHLDRPAHERAKAVSAAKAKIGQACRLVGHGAIQIHGGMGIADETPVSHYFKRATVIRSQFGSTEHHLARYEELALAPADREAVAA